MQILVSPNCAVKENIARNVAIFILFAFGWWSCKVRVCVDSTGPPSEAASQDMTKIKAYVIQHADYSHTN